MLEWNFAHHSNSCAHTSISLAFLALFVVQPFEAAFSPHSPFRHDGRRSCYHEYRQRPQTVMSNTHNDGGKKHTHNSHHHGLAAAAEALPQERTFPSSDATRPQPHSNKRQLAFDKSGILYRRSSVLTRQEMDVVSGDIQNHVRLVDERVGASVARGRRGALVPEVTRHVFQDGSPSRLVKHMVGEDYHLANDIPVEVRVYETVGASMDWHVDDVLYDPPQVEVVYTLENTSDCTTRWRIASEQQANRENTSNVEIVEEQTEPNSILLLQAGRVPHCVTPLKRGGRRVIIKCAYVCKNARRTSDALITQFSGKRKGRRRKRQR